MSVAVARATSDGGQRGRWPSQVRLRVVRGGRVAAGGLGGAGREADPDDRVGDQDEQAGADHAEEAQLEELGSQEHVRHHDAEPPDQEVHDRAGQERDRGPAVGERGGGGQGGGGDEREHRAS